MMARLLLLLCSLTLAQDALAARAVMEGIQTSSNVVFVSTAGKQFLVGSSATTAGYVFVTSGPLVHFATSTTSSKPLEGWAGVDGVVVASMSRLGSFLAKDVQLTGVAPASTTAGALYMDTLIQSWAVFTGTGTPTVMYGVNVASITDNGAGDYSVNMWRGFSDSYYCVSCMVVSASSASCVLSVEPTAKQFKINTYIGATKSDFDKIYVMAVGKP